MIRSTYSIVAIAIIATTCMASNINNDVMLPNLDLGLSIDEQNVEMIQVKETNRIFSVREGQNSWILSFSE